MSITPSQQDRRIFGGKGDQISFHFAAARFLPSTQLGKITYHEEALKGTADTMSSEWLLRDAAREKCQLGQRDVWRIPSAEGEEIL